MISVFIIRRLMVRVKSLSEKVPGFYLAPYTLYHLPFLKFFRFYQYITDVTKNHNCQDE